MALYAVWCAGTRAACVNAAFLALAHAGVPLRDMVAAVGVGYVEDRILLGE